MERLTKWLLVIAIIIPNLSFAGTKVIDYGFEDWSGWSANTSPSNGWIFSQPDEPHFIDNRDSTIGTIGGVNCDGNTAYAGSYYYHTQYNTSASDACLGRTSASINHRMYIGYDSNNYPTGTKNTTMFPASLPSNTETLRFRFRVTDDWTSSQTGIDDGGGMKFIRQAIGRSYFSDGNNILIKILNDGDDSDPQIGIYQPLATTTYYHSGVNWQDGNWHSLTMKAINTGALEYAVSIYMDDWDMEGQPFGSRTITMAPGESDGFYSISLNSNWSAQYPPNLMGMDFDDFEVWDGLPSGTPTITCYPDLDGDQYPDSGSESVETCSTDYYESSHFLSMTTDCNDSNANINPGATDICGNGIAEDCVADVACVTTKTALVGIGTATVGSGTMIVR